MSENIGTHAYLLRINSEKSKKLDHLAIIDYVKKNFKKGSTYKPLSDHSAEIITELSPLGVNFIDLSEVECFKDAAVIALEFICTIHAPDWLKEKRKSSSNNLNNV